MLQQKIPKRNDENLKKCFTDTFKFSDHGINKFILLLSKGVYSPAPNKRHLSC